MPLLKTFITFSILEGEKEILKIYCCKIKEKSDVFRELVRSLLN